MTSAARWAVAVERALVARGQLVCCAEDAVALTGLSPRQAEQALMELARTRPSTLEVLEGGALRFRFEKLGAPTRWPWFTRWWSTSGPLVLDTAAYALLCTVLLALGSTLMSGNLARLLEVPGAILLVGAALAGFPFFLAVLANTLLVQHALVSGDHAGLDTRLFLEGLLVLLCSAGLLWLLSRAPRLLAPRGGWWRAWRGFLLGPRREDQVLVRRRQVAALFKDLGGVVAVGDFMAHLGWTEEEAHAALPSLVAEHGAELLVDPQLHLVLRVARCAQVEAAVPDEKAPEFFACSRRATFWCGALLLAATAAGLAMEDAPWFPGPNTEALRKMVTPFKLRRVVSRIDDVANDGFGLWPLVLGATPLLLRLRPHLRRGEAFRRHRDQRARLAQNPAAAPGRDFAAALRATDGNAPPAQVVFSG